MADQTARLALMVPIREGSPSGLYNHAIPIKFQDMGDGTYAPVVSTGGGGGADRELVVSVYTATASGTGYSTGDTITETQLIDVVSTPSTVTTIWRNQTTQADIAQPVSANITIAGGGGMTNAQFQATFGTTSDAAAGSDGATATFVSLFRRMLGKFGPLGQNATTSSISVAIASDDAKFGQKTTASMMPSGGVGLFGWLSAIADYIRGLPTAMGAGVADTSATAGFTRPADTAAYVSGDLVANSTTAGSVTPLSFTVARATGLGFLIRRIRLRKTGTSTTNASFRLHLFSASPTVANGDNGVYSSSGSATYLGAFDVSFMQAFTDGAAGIGVPTAGFEGVGKVSGGQIVYGLIEARAAYTPENAETFSLTLEALQD